jgi:hypothetical protein
VGGRKVTIDRDARVQVVASVLIIFDGSVCEATQYGHSSPTHRFFEDGLAIWEMIDIIPVWAAISAHNLETIGYYQPILQSIDSIR